MNIVDLDKLCEMFWDGNFMEIHKNDIPSIPSAFEGMTNGEVIQAVFPKTSVFENIECRYPYIDVFYSDENGMPMHSYKKEWWNAPYKGVSE